MIQGIGHIGIAVENIEQVLDQLCRALALTRPEIKHVPEHRMKVAVLQLGPVGLELLEETVPGGILSGPVKAHGDFIHHLCLVSDQLDEDMAALEKRGVQLAQARPAVGLRGKRIAFVKAGLLGQIPVELSEP